MGRSEDMDEMSPHEGHLFTGNRQKGKGREVLLCASSRNIRYRPNQILESIDTKISIHLSSNPSSVDNRFPQFPSS